MRLFIAAAVTVAIAIPAVAAETKVALTGENTKITFVGTKPGGKHEYRVIAVNGVGLKSMPAAVR